LWKKRDFSDLPHSTWVILCLEFDASLSLPADHLSKMSAEHPVVRLTPRRCGNCRHAARTAALDGGLVTCVIRLEYQCVDRVPDCGDYLPADRGGEWEPGED